MTEKPLLFTKRFGYGLLIFGGIIAMYLSCSLPFSSKCPEPGSDINFQKAKSAADFFNMCLKLAGNQLGRAKYLAATAYFWYVIFTCLILGWPQLTLQPGNRLIIYFFLAPVTVLMALSGSTSASDMRREAFKIFVYKLYNGNFESASNELGLDVKAALFGNSFELWTAILNVAGGLLWALLLTYVYTIPEDYQGFWKFMKFMKPYQLQQDTKWTNKN